MSFIMIREDITKIKVDAVVNAANTGLLMGDGVCGAIFAAAGPQKLRRACSRLAPIRVGEAVVTPGFALPAKYIIHAAGPVYRRQESGQCERELRAAYASALRLALENGCESIAFPLISSGIYGYPKTEALRTAVSEIRRFLEKHEMAVYLAVLDKTAFAADGGLVAEVGRYLGERYIDRSEVFGAALPVSAKAGAQREEEESREAQDFRAGKIRIPEKVSHEKNAEIPAVVPIKQSAGILRRFPRDKEDGGQRKEYSPKEVTGKKQSLFASLRTEKGRRNVPGECSSGGRRSVAGKSPAGREAPVARSLDKTNPAKLRELVAALDEPFSEALLHLIDERGYTDAEVYRRANLDRRLFSKIRTNSAYMPSKRTAIALAVALQLNLSETRELLARAGYALSHSQKFDVIVEYFIVNGKYDLYEINEILFQYDQPLLGGEK